MSRDELVEKIVAIYRLKVPYLTKLIKVWLLVSSDVKAGADCLGLPEESMAQLDIEPALFALKPDEPEPEKAVLGDYMREFDATYLATTKVAHSWDKKKKGVLCSMMSEFDIQDWKRVLSLYARSYRAHYERKQKLEFELAHVVRDFSVFIVKKYRDYLKRQIVLEDKKRKMDFEQTNIVGRDGRAP